jgi:hypothetical protein
VTTTALVGVEVRVMVGCTVGEGKLLPGVLVNARIVATLAEGVGIAAEPIQAN